MRSKTSPPHANFAQRALELPPLAFLELEALVVDDMASSPVILYNGVVGLTVFLIV